MSTEKEYTGDDIKVLTDVEHVRLRTSVYLGSMHPTLFTIPLLSSNTIQTTDVVFIPAAYKAICEVIDNCLDEFAHINIKNKTLTIKAEPTTGKYTIADNGRGIPIEKKIEVIGKTEKEVWVPELALARLRAGRNFTDEKEIGVIGQNGVGVACTNFCSTVFEVTVYRADKIYHQKFSKGCTVISKPKITETKSSKTGTEISFQLDPEVFKNVNIPELVLRNKAIEIALTNPDITVHYNNEVFCFKKGMLGYLKDKITNEQCMYTFSVQEPNVQGEIYVIGNIETKVDEQMFTWVNSSYLYDGGKCNTQFLNLLYDNVTTHFEKEIKKLKIEMTKNDIKKDLIVFANLKVKNPEYDSQAKTRLTGPDVRKEFTGLFNAHWKQFSKTMNPWLLKVMEYTQQRYHLTENKKAIDEHEKKQRKKIRVENLLDAASSDRQKCSVLITEGLSAKSRICEARDPETIAAYALTGKINNVWGCTPAQVLKMGKLTDLLTVIGLTPGKKALKQNLNYGKIIIATDADHDGSDIFTLLVNLFYQFWPELMDPKQSPTVYRLVAPNVCLVKGKQRIHFAKKEDYEQVKEKYKGYTVNYYKGLGSMAKADWEMVLSGKTNTLVPIVDDGKIKETMELLFGPSADQRKTWLTTTIEYEDE